MENQKKNLLWYNLAMMAFVSVWAFGNIVNNFANQGLTVIVSWILIIGLYFLICFFLNKINSSLVIILSSSIQSKRRHENLYLFHLQFVYGS